MLSFWESQEAVALLLAKAPYITTVTAAIAAANSIAAYRENKSEARSLRGYHKNIGQ